MLLVLSGVLLITIAVQVSRFASPAGAGSDPFSRNGLPYVISGTIPTPLQPGAAAVPIDVTFRSPNAGSGGAASRRHPRLPADRFDREVTPAGDQKRVSCSGSDFAVRQFNGDYPFFVPFGSSSLSSLGSLDETGRPSAWTYRGKPESVPGSDRHTRLQGSAMTRRVPRLRRSRYGLGLVGAAAATLVVATAAVAYFTSIGAGSEHGDRGHAPYAHHRLGHPGSGTVDVSWAPGIAPPVAGPVTYYVERDGGDAAGCPTAAAPTAVTSCTDTNPSAGSNTYTVTAVWRSWTETSDPASTTPLSAPTVSSASPSSRGQGAANQSIIISGTGFVSGATVAFSGTGITVNSTTFDNSTQITANITVAVGATVGARNVTVTNPDTGAGTRVGGFTVNPGLTVTSATPPSRPQGVGSQNIVIAGTGFVSGAAATFSGTGITVNSTTFTSATQVTANITLAVGATVGPRDITVTNPDGGIGVGTGIFTVNASLTGVSTSPSFRNQGAANQNIAISGTGFVSGATVAFSGSGITINSTTYNSSTQVTVNITISGSATTGARDVTLTNPGGASVTGTGVFNVNPAPTLTSAAPSSRGRGATNQNITLTGTGFIDGASLAASFGTLITVNSTSFVNATTVMANITVGATATTGVRSVTVTNGDGTIATGNVFTVNAAPTVTSATPSSRGQGAVNQNIAIVGTGFVSRRRRLVLGHRDHRQLDDVQHRHLADGEHHDRGGCDDRAP